AARTIMSSSFSKPSPAAGIGHSCSLARPVLCARLARRAAGAEFMLGIARNGAKIAPLSGNAIYAQAAEKPIRHLLFFIHRKHNLALGRHRCDSPITISRAISKPADTTVRRHVQGKPWRTKGRGGSARSRTR